MKKRGMVWVETRRGWFWPSAGALCVLACGGKANDGDGGDSTGAEAGASSVPATGSTPGNTKLGPCQLGFVLEAEPTRDCAWLARERCFETKLAACACICPANRQDSVCSSGFDDGPNGKTEVKCY